MEESEKLHLQNQDSHNENSSEIHDELNKDEHKKKLGISSVVEATAEVGAVAVGAAAAAVRATAHAAANAATKIKESSEPLEKGRTSFVKHLFLIFFLIMFVGIGAFIAYNYFITKKFNTWQSFKEYINSFGWGAPIDLTVFQAVKVIYAVIPGAIGCIAGASVLGPVKGFICNYIGICTGSIAAFFISRKFGESFMRQIFSKKQYESGMKWMGKLKNSYSVFFWIAICSPIAPDDFLCYFTGLTTMSTRRFLILLLTAKIWTILGYSLIFGNVI